MSSRIGIMRDAVLLGLGIAGLVLVVLAAALWVTGTLSLDWFAHALLIIAVIVFGAEAIVLSHALGTMQLRSSITGRQRADNTQGCGIAMLLGVVVALLFVCAGTLNWLAAR